MQALMETIRRSQDPLVAVKSNDIAHAIEERGAITALLKVPLKGRLMDGVEILIDIV
jgi:hypothetical protein